MFKINVLKISLLLASLFNFFEVDDTYNKNQKMMNKIINYSIKQVTSRYGAYAIGTGKAVCGEKSKMESVSFEIRKKLSRDEARILLVEIVELILHNINNNSQISSFLYNYPFTYRNLQIRIFMCDKDGSNFYYPDLCLVSLMENGVVSFKTNDPNNKFDYASVEKETYEKAYKIVTQGTL